MSYRKIQELRKHISGCNNMLINGDRVVDRLYKLGEKGKNIDGGITRLPYTKEYKEAEKLIKAWMYEAKMEVKQDYAGNLLGFYNGSDPDLPVVMVGSHLDTVPNGGLFDGSLGVVAGIECVQSFVDNDIVPSNTIVVVAFVDEEGVRFNKGYFGSRAVVGKIDDNELEDKDVRGITRRQAMLEYNLDPDYIGFTKWDQNRIKNYFELHIEQGNVLESLNIPLGVVIGISAPNWFTVKFTGQADHAGATPMNLRRDALTATAELILTAESEAIKSDQDIVVTTGQILISPNRINIIPEKVEVSFDVRHYDKAKREDVVEKIKEEARKIALARSLDIEFKDLLNSEPVTLPLDVVDSISQLVSNHGIENYYMISGAGHDAMIMAELTKVGMLFVPSHKGISHCPKEWTDFDSCKLGTQVLASVLLSFAN